MVALACACKGHPLGPLQAGYTSALATIIAAFFAPPSRRMVGMAPLIAEIDAASQITPCEPGTSCRTTPVPGCHLIPTNSWSSAFSGYPGSQASKSHGVPSRHRHDISASRSAPRKAVVSVGPMSCPKMAVVILVNPHVKILEICHVKIHTYVYVPCD